MSVAATEKLDEFRLPIQGGLLDNLGINMYANLGKCLVEFAANAYDGDSPGVDIVLDINGILDARKSVREAAIADAKASGKKTPTFVEAPLPANYSVTISDTGSGMTPLEVQNKFLPINRNRRKDASGEETAPKSESGKRYVMGRKGIGKLSGFGAASRLTVKTKRVGQDYWTSFELGLNELRNEKSLDRVVIKPTYTPGDLAEHGTILTLAELKCDSMKFKEEDLHEALADAFFPVKHEEFAIQINGQPIRRAVPEYSFSWPEERPDDGFAVATVTRDGGGDMDFRYVAHFRKRSLQAYKRGARVYCNKRLAFGPSMLSLDTGMHNFMAHAYLEFIVEADELDRQNVDLISTDRGDILRNNDLIDAFLARVTALMRDAIQAHSSHRDAVAETEFQTDPRAEAVRKIISSMPARQQAAGKKIVNVIVSRYGLASEEFTTIAPLLVTSMNAGEVLVDLIKVANNPKDIEQLARHILDLGEIERSDALKLYRGRRNGIVGLRNLADRGEDEWIKGKRSEAELHNLLKEAPWLIRPDLSGFVASDVDMTKVVTVLAKELGVDSFAAPAADEDKKDKTRPDLVFLLGNASQADRILIVELKSPNLPLEAAHLTQLKGYIRKVRAWLRTEHGGHPRPHVVEGLLIGAMPAHDTKADGPSDLLYEIENRGPSAEWEVVGLRELLARTEAVHRDLIATLVKEVPDEPPADAADVKSGTPSFDAVDSILSPAIAETSGAKVKPQEA